MNEIRPATDDRADGESSEAERKVEKRSFQNQVHQQMDELDTSIEKVPPEAAKLSIFLEREVFNKYDIPESGKLKLVKEWYLHELDMQMLDPEYDVTTEGADYFEAEISKSYEVQAGIEESTNNEAFLNQLKNLQTENNWSKCRINQLCFR